MLPLLTRALPSHGLSILVSEVDNFDFSSGEPQLGILTILRVLRVGAFQFRYRQAPNVRPV